MFGKGVDGLFNGKPENTISRPLTYCPKCGGYGRRPDGTICDCVNAKHAYFDAISCLDIPQQYVGKQFSSKLVPRDCGDAYVGYLQKLYNEIVSMKVQNYNCLICSPIAHSKTVMAYSAMEVLFKHNIPTFPVCSVMEAKRVLHDIDVCAKETIEGFSNPENIIRAPYIFLKIPIMLTWEVYPTIADIIDRRVRRNLSTIILFDGYWDDLVKFDRNGILTALKGDGYFNTIDIHNFYRVTENTEAIKFQQLLNNDDTGDDYGI